MGVGVGVLEEEVRWVRRSHGSWAGVCGPRLGRSDAGSAGRAGWLLARHGGPVGGR